jgi:hypothetical protein
MANANIKEIFQKFPANAVNDDDLFVFYSDSGGVTKAVKATDILGQTSATQNFQWVSTATYSTSDPVLYSGQWYISLQDNNTGNVPSENSFWTRENKVSAITVKPYQNGVYDSANVIVSVGQEMYKMKANPPLNANESPVTDTTNWELFPYVEPVQKSGTQISFAKPEDYGTDLVPLTGTLTDSNILAKKGNPQKIYHQDASLVVPADWVLMGGIEYEAGVLNLIVVEWERNDRKIYWIAQEA